MNPRIIFISHESSRTGAPIVLLHFIRWFKQNIGWPFDVLLVLPGELESDFAELGPTQVVSKMPWHDLSTSRRVVRKLGFDHLGRRFHDAVIRRQFSSPPPALIYSNTIANLKELTLLAPLACPVLCHVHELETIFEEKYPTGTQAWLSKVDHFIACCDAVRSNLIQTQHVQPDKIDMIHEFIPALDAKVPDYDHRLLIRQELGLPANALIVGGAGSLCWRKGTDLFVQLGHEIRKANLSLPVYFVWLGKNTGMPFVEAMYDARRLGIEDRFVITGLKTDPLRYFAAFDVLALTSREDPYPLVCLEAASVAKPIVCFANAGGMPEFIKQDCGFVVPYLDIKAMATRVLTLLADPQLARSFGSVGRERVRANHDVSVAAPRIFEVMRKMLANEVAAGHPDNRGLLL